MSNPTNETVPTQFVSHFIESSGGDMNATYRAIELSGPGKFSEVRKPAEQRLTILQSLSGIDEFRPLPAL